MKNIVAVNTNSYHAFTVDQALEGIAAAGFKYIEIATVRGWTEHIMPEFADEEIDRIAKKAADLGLTFIGMSGHCNLMFKERIEDFKNNMKLAHRLGCKYINSSVGEAHFGKDEVFSNDVLVENLKSLLPLLEEYDMTMGIETHGPEHGTGTILAEITNAVGSDRIGVCLDTANVVFYGNVRPEEEITRCMDSIKFVHLKDKVGYDQVWNFPAVGSGELKLLETVKYANEHDFFGPFSMEVEYTEAFTVRPERTADDLAYVNGEMKKAYDYMVENGIID